MTGHGAYLLCFDRPFGHARHYLGWSCNVTRRIATHRKGGADCARLLAALKRAGIGWRVVKVWPGLERDDERRLKNRGGKSRICPACRSGGTLGPAH